MATESNIVAKTGAIMASIPLSMFYVAKWKGLPDIAKIQAALGILSALVPMEEQRKYATDILSNYKDIDRIRGEFSRDPLTYLDISNEMTYAKQFVNYKAYLGTKVVRVKEPMESLSHLSLSKSLDHVPINVNNSVLSVQGLSIPQAVAAGNDFAMSQSNTLSVSTLPKIKRRYVDSVSSDPDTRSNSESPSLVLAGLPVVSYAKIINQGVLTGDIDGKNVSSKVMSVVDLGTLMVDSEQELKLNFTNKGVRATTVPKITNSSFFSRLEQDLHGFGLNNLLNAARFDKYGIKINNFNNEQLEEKFRNFCVDRKKENGDIAITMPFNLAWLSKEIAVRETNVDTKKLYDAQYDWLLRCNLYYMGPGVASFLLTYDPANVKNIFVSHGAFNIVHTVVTRYLKYYNYVRVLLDSHDLPFSTWMDRIQRHCDARAKEYVAFYMHIFSVYNSDVNIKCNLTSVSTEAKQVKKIVSLLGDAQKGDDSKNLTKIDDIFNDDDVAQFQSVAPDDYADDSDIYYPVVDFSLDVVTSKMENIMLSMPELGFNYIAARILIGTWLQRWIKPYGEPTRQVSVQLFINKLSEIIKTKDVTRIRDTIVYAYFKNVGPEKMNIYAPLITVIGETLELAKRDFDGIIDTGKVGGSGGSANNGKDGEQKTNSGDGKHEKKTKKKNKSKKKKKTKKESSSISGSGDSTGSVSGSNSSDDGNVKKNVKKTGKTKKEKKVIEESHTGDNNLFNPNVGSSNYVFEGQFF